jgi:hypothetical protein
MTELDDQEYGALRATIRERGTARVWTLVAGIAVWSALTAAVAALAATPLATLLPLVMLIATFEAVYALHVGVERIGRYLQVFYETGDRHPHWERAAMAFGRPANAARVDPLFAIVFAIAALVNLAPAALLRPIAPEWIVVGGAHVLFALRIVYARAAAGRQRAIDLARFQEIRDRGFE